LLEVALNLEIQMSKNSRTIVALSLFFALIVPVAFCQGRSQSNPEAVALVDRAIEAMGGAELWMNHHGAAVQGTIQSGGATNGPFSFLSKTDWKKGSLRFRSEVQTSQGAHVRTFDPQKGSSVQHNGVVKTLPSYVDLGALPFYLPGAALYLMRSSSKYSFELVDNESSRTERSVRVMWPDQVMHDGFAKETWTFSTETGLPVRVITAVAAVLHPSRPLSKTIRFVSFQTQNGAVVPKGIEIAMPNGRTDKIDISKIEFANSLGDNDFILAR
jgi:hypothetical protein